MEDGCLVAKGGESVWTLGNTSGIEDFVSTPTPTKTNIALEKWWWEDGPYPQGDVSSFSEAPVHNPAHGESILHGFRLNEVLIHAPSWDNIIPRLYTHQNSTDLPVGVFSYDKNGDVGPRMINNLVNSGTSWDQLKW